MQNNWELQIYILGFIFFLLFLTAKTLRHHKNLFRTRWFTLQQRSFRNRVYRKRGMPRARDIAEAATLQEATTTPNNLQNEVVLVPPPALPPTANSILGPTITMLQTLAHNVSTQAIQALQTSASQASYNAAMDLIKQGCLATSAFILAPGTLEFAEDLTTPHTAKDIAFLSASLGTVVNTVQSYLDFPKRGEHLYEKSLALQKLAHNIYDKLESNLSAETVTSLSEFHSQTEIEFHNILTSRII